MLDVIASPYGPCEIDCTGDVECWPWVVTVARPVVAPVDYTPKPRPVPAPKSIRPCTAHGCTALSAAVRRRTHPELYDFCDRHRIAGLARIRKGRHPETVADDMTAGCRIIGRPRSAA